MKKNRNIRQGHAPRALPIQKGWLASASCTTRFINFNSDLYPLWISFLC